jgi:LacI family transcriptional regulator
MSQAMNAKHPSAGRRVLYLPGWNVQAVHEGIVKYAREAGWILDNTMAYSAEIPVGVRVDGIICRHSGEPRILDAIRDYDVPTVAFEHDERLPLPRVYYDEDAVGAAAAQHLIKRGFTNLCFLHLRWRYSSHQLERMAGFERTAKEAGLTCTELAPKRELPTWHPAPGEAWNWLKQELGDMDFPVGIMVSNDQIARVLVEALVDMGYRIPAQIAIVSAENDPLLCETGLVPISSVETCTSEMGYEAASMLDRLMDGGTPPKEPKLIQPHSVAARKSSNVMALKNIHAAEALHFIWENFRKPITVADVGHQVPLTRRRLQTLFVNHVGRTMREEIRRLRVAEVCRLLKTTDLKIGDIAARCGFTSGMQLHRTITAELDMCPRVFRAKGTLPDELPLPVA